MTIVRRCAFLLAATALGAALSISAAWAAPVRLIAERITPTGSGDLALLNYPSLADLLNGTNLSQDILPLGNILSPSFDIAGFTTDGNGFRLIAERITPTGSGDLALLYYPSLADLLNGTNLSQDILPLGNILSPSFDIAGFDIEQTSPVPEPHPLALLLAGLVCTALVMRANPRTGRA